MKYRKFILILLALCCIAFVFVGCNEGQQSEDSNDPQATVMLNIVEHTMNVGDNVLISADKKCTWTVSDDSIVSVNDGFVTAKKLGKATVTAEYQGAKATCTITVTDELLGEPVFTAELKSEKLVVSETTEIFPIAVFGSQIADNNKLSFTVTSSNSDVISVDGFRLSGIGEGNCTITLTLKYKEKEYSVQKNMIVRSVSDIWFEKKEISAAVTTKFSLELKGVFTEENGIQNVAYDISDKSVIQYENGVFTALKPGTAIITAVYKDLTAECVVRVCNIVSTVKEFIKIFDNPTDNYIVLADIDLSNVNLRQYRKDFDGYLDGNGYSLKGISYNEWQSSLFKTVSGTIKNVNFENATFSGSNPLIQTGLVAHTLDGARIDNCKFDVTFNNVGSGDYSYATYASWGMFAGVIAAYNDNSFIKDCYISFKTPHNNKNDYIGSIVGLNRGDITLDNVIVEKAGDVEFFFRDISSVTKINSTGTYNKEVATRIAELNFYSDVWERNDGRMTLKNGIVDLGDIISYRVVTQLRNINDDGYEDITSETYFCVKGAQVSVDDPTDEIYGFTFNKNSSVLAAVVNGEGVCLYYRYERKEFTVKLTAAGETVAKKYKYGQECDVEKDFDLTPPEVAGKRFIGYGENALEIFEVVKDFEGQAVYATPISTNEQFKAIANDLAGNYVLTASLDFSDEKIEMIEGEFSGILDGNGYSIKNLRLEKLASDNVWNHTTALFRRFSGTIKNIAFENATVYVENNVVNCGIVSSVFTGYADNVYANVTVLRTYYQWNTQQSGALFGKIGDAVVRNCFITCSIDGGSAFGNIAGVVIGDIEIDRIVVSASNNVGVFAALDVEHSVNGGACVSAKQAQSAIGHLLIGDKQTIIENADNVLSSVWTCDGFQLPVLANMKKMERKEVSTFTEFVSTIRENDNSYIVLTDDITYDDAVVTALNGAKVISVNFSGIIDGQGHTIKSVVLNANNDSDMRLFRFFTGSIKNIAIEATMHNGDGQKSAAGVIALEFSGVAENVKLVLKAVQVYMNGGFDTQQSGGLFGRLANGAYVKNVLIDFTPGAGDGNVTGFGFVAGFVKENASVKVENVVVINRGETARPIIALAYNTSTINGVKPVATTRYHSSADNAAIMNDTIITNALVDTEANVITNAGSYLGSAWICDGIQIPYIRHD